MPTFIQHSETKYDFSLIFRITPAPKLNETIQSPISDDNGQLITFQGTAVFVAVETRFYEQIQETVVYVRQYPPLIRYE